MLNEQKLKICFSYDKEAILHNVFFYDRCRRGQFPNQLNNLK